MVVVDCSILPPGCVDLSLVSDAVVAADTTEDGEGVTGSVSENNSSDGGNCEYWCVWCV